MSADILTRLRQATGPDRELDAHILCAIHGYTMHENSDPSTGIFAFWENGICHNCSSWGNPTASIDASIALVERMLPGKHIVIGKGQTELTKPWARIGSWSGCDAVAETLPLAILIALFTALQETDNDHG